jgi:hypothetical protein
MYMILQGSGEELALLFLEDLSLFETGTETEIEIEI